MLATKPKKRKDPLDDPEFKKFVQEAETFTPIPEEPDQTPAATETKDIKMPVQAPDDNAPLPKKTKAATGKATRLPWEGKEYPEKLKPFMNFSLDEEYIEKLRWVSKQMKKNQMEIIRDLLRPFLDQYIKDHPAK